MRRWRNTKSSLWNLTATRNRPAAPATDPDTPARLVCGGRNSHTPALTFCRRSKPAAQLAEIKKAVWRNGGGGWGAEIRTRRRRETERVKREICFLVSMVTSQRDASRTREEDREKRSQRSDVSTDPLDKRHLCQCKSANGAAAAVPRVAPGGAIPAASSLSWGPEQSSPPCSSSSIIS